MAESAPGCIPTASDLSAHCQAIYERAPLPMAAVEGPSRIVCYVNPAFSRLVGKPPEQLAGKPFAEIIPENDPCLMLLERVYRTGKSESHTGQQDPELQVFWSWTMWPVLVGDRPAGVMIQVTESAQFDGLTVAMNEALILGSVRQHELTEAAENLNAQLQAEVVERKQVERKLQQQTEALTDLDRRKDEFLAMLSHELRNPLAALSNAVHLLRLQKNEDPVQGQARGVITRQVAQLKHLVDDLLEISRITTGRIQLRRERIALAGIVERAVETVQPLIGQRGHALTVALPPDPVWLQADAARLEQVLVNLLTNAAKYTGEGGHVWLELQQEGNEAVLRVRDTGIGIAPELLPRIFDLFTQAERSLDRSQGGLGIGLCLVQRLVELHGGTVAASSVLGQGSEFVVRLPALRIGLLQLSSSLPAPATCQTPGTSRRVLVVDDNLDAAQSLADLLEATGHVVKTAHDGPAALQALQEFTADLVLLDIGLPGLTGLEVAKRIRQIPGLKSMVLVAMTGYGQEADRQRSKEAGFDHHLVKPADFGEVEKILATVGESASPVRGRGN